MKTLKLYTMTLMLFASANIMSQSLEGQFDLYRVTAHQKDNNQVISVSNEVKVIPSAVFYIPSAFTPNGDGLNETFGLIGQGITDYKLQIFNRWGNLIFESNDINMQWDGTYANEIVPMDTYVYTISGIGEIANGERKKQINEKGTVTVVL